MLEAILFDLDGTLLPMDQDEFIKYYFTGLAKAAYPWGYTDSQKLMKAIWGGTGAMVKNDSDKFNIDLFWETFGNIMNAESKEDTRFDSFYRNEFHAAKASCKENPYAKEMVKLARKKAHRVILATNPIFPEVADESRLSWIDMKMSDFDYVSDYSNSKRAKPNPEYYEEILKKFNLNKENCLMVGNDIDEDMVPCQKIGLPVFIIEDHLINKSGKEITCPHGNVNDFLEYLKSVTN